VTAVVCPNEEELYLLSILLDERGLDQGEFIWSDPVNDHGRYRAWDFQWVWYSCDDMFQVDQSGRSVGKTMRITMRAYAFPFVYPGQSMLITAPELNHLQPITIAIEERLLGSRFTREMLPKGAKTNGINKTPHWQATFTNGTKIVSRLPNKDGRGVKGMHVLAIELDEAQDFPLAGWIEIVETLNRGQPGASWSAHGVPKGVRDKFYDMTEGSEDDDTIKWTVHRPMAFMKPTWTPEERAEKMVQYGGSRQNIDYKRNIYGEHGDQTHAIFVLARLMACVDTDEGSIYNQDVYRCYKIEYEDLPRTDGLDEEEAMFARQDYIERIIAIPAPHKAGWTQHVGTKEVGATKGYGAYWAGMDVGVCVDDQTEIFTRRGWLTHDQVQIGDESLAINPTTGRSEWQSITDMYRRYKPDWDMILMEGQSFSAMTTPHHKWLVQSEAGHWRWRESRYLNTKDRIPLTVPRGDAPTKEVYEDDFVELVAWYVTEGSRQAKYGSKSVCQSLTANPDKVKRIRGCLERLYGPSGAVRFGPYRPLRGGPLWSEVLRPLTSKLPVSSRHPERNDYRHSDMVYSYFSKPISDAIELVAPGASKTPTVTFLSLLTIRQLDLFIDVCILGDGWVQDSRQYIEQADLSRIKALEAACALAGRATTTCYDALDGIWHTAIKVKTTVAPASAARMAKKSGLTSQSMTIDSVTYDGVIWCPTLPAGNWLARRNGSIYFTGNTNHPSEIVVFGQRKEADQLDLLLRVNMHRIKTGDQKFVVQRLFELYGPALKAFGVDKTGVGQPIWADLTDIPAIAKRVHGFNFSENRVTGFEDRDLVDKETKADLAIMRNVVEASTDWLRNDYVDNKRMLLPFDREVLLDMQNQTYTVIKDNGSPYGKKRLFSGGSFHVLDGMKMAIAGKHIPPLEAMLTDTSPQPDVLDMFIGQALGGSLPDMVW
jgi:hypothetical protein